MSPRQSTSAPQPPTLSPDAAVKILREQIARATALADSGEVHSDDFSAWMMATEQVLTDALGRDHRMAVQALNAGGPIVIRASSSSSFLGRHAPRASGHAESAESQRATRLRSRAKALETCIEHLERQAARSAGAANESAADALLRIRKVMDTFHRVVLGLRNRHDGRDTLNVTDEYDVQDLLRVLLSVDFDDVRREEPAPSVGGIGARLDFLLKVEEVVIEAKVTRTGRREKVIRDELLVDISTYSAHPNCKTLVCFVYDPSGQIGNPAALERDLSGSREGLDVHVYVRPKH